MRTRLIALPFLFLTAGLAVANEREWFYSETKDPMTDMVSQSLVLQSEEENAHIVLACYGTVGVLTVTWEEFIRLDRASVEARVDSAPVQQLYWTMSEDGKTSTHPLSGKGGLGAFVSDVSGGSVLRLRASAFGEVYELATFRTAGLSDLLPRLKACWRGPDPTGPGPDR